MILIEDSHTCTGPDATRRRSARPGGAGGMPSKQRVSLGLERGQNFHSAFTVV